MGRNVSSGGGGDLEARLHPQEVSWWAWAAEVVGVLLVEGATKGAWRKRGKIGWCHVGAAADRLFSKCV